MTSQNSTTTGRPDRTAQQNADSALLRNCIAAALVLAFLALVLFWIVMGSAFANVQY